MTPSKASNSCSSAFTSRLAYLSVADFTSTRLPNRASASSSSSTTERARVAANTLWMFFSVSPTYLLTSPTSRTDRRSPARIEDAERQSSTAPSAPAVPDLAETVAIGGVTGASATGSAEATSTAKDAVERLPQDIAARFPDADLSGVRVHRDAQQAAATGAAAFTQGNDIFVAPGQLTPEVLAHEAAHVVQQRLGRSAPTGQDGKAREREAEGAEKKNRVPSSTLGAATPGTRQNKEKAPDGTEVEKKGPRLNITLGGTLKGELGLRAWLDGWFIDEQKEWTFAQFPIAWFDGFRLDALGQPALDRLLVEAATLAGFTLDAHGNTVAFGPAVDASERARYVFESSSVQVET